MDPRSTPANGRVAASALRGQVQAEAFVDGQPAQVVRPLVDLLRAPDGPRDRQLVSGARVQVFETRAGISYVQAAQDGYVGYVPEAALGPARAATHRVISSATHGYQEPDIKSREAGPLYFGALVEVVSHMPKFYETSDGLYIPKPHLRATDRLFSDPVTLAQLFFGAPYLWGGNTVAGIDCSGLVQAACLACGLDCPGDSDQQEAVLGAPLPSDAPPQRGDVLFWRGHVAMLVDETTLIHANAHHMAVAYEPAEQTIFRIAAQGDGDVTSRRRLPRL